MQGSQPVCQVHSCINQTFDRASVARNQAGGQKVGLVAVCTLKGSRLHRNPVVPLSGCAFVFVGCLPATLVFSSAE